MLRNEPARLDLFHGLEQVLGEARATTLMTYLPSTTELASHEDVRRLERRMDERFARMEVQTDERFARIEEQMRERFALMDEQMRERFESLRGTVNERYNSLEFQIQTGDSSTATNLHRDMTRLITIQTAIIMFAFVGALATIVTLFL